MVAIVEKEKVLTQSIIPKGWIATTWEDFLQISQAVSNDKAKFYYFQGNYYSEMGVGADHAFVNTVVIILISLYCMKRNILAKGYTNCSYRKEGIRECQPDISYYVGDRTQNAPQSIAIVDLDESLPPDIVIEIADTSLGYDLGAKRLLYEEVRVGEYWVIDVQNMKITAFRILQGLGSERITESSVLGGLRLSLLEEALQRSREIDNSQIGSWFMEQLG
ncbi:MULTISPECIES: Uma2 family endonuclease [Pseudanabaena]|jgi:Uma2 family endonuclease|uniref:Uma2 family endonuclease n=1 Tax=Pseudanabaena TaxID=1152 RepID=UPI00247ACD28|nr:MULTISPECIES: Uma2 family endonuclease [Pseudanabaena]MEA5488850.1 Uma2 family endonuclease [Pseudanabaena sp. CCNP1317]WGS74912.1 Uma2 family endonuclease [Pseudanabaena galeata CCNP1313]